MRKHACAFRMAAAVLAATVALAHPTVRKTVTAGASARMPGLQGKFGSSLSEIGPDIKRYLKLKSM